LIVSAGIEVTIAIGSVTIGGRVEFANILAGYDLDLVPTNGDAQIGPVKVGGDWIASNLVAGVQNTASTNTSFGNGNDAAIPDENPATIATITSISIGGYIYGTPLSANSGDHFGFVAQKIGSF